MMDTKQSKKFCFLIAKLEGRFVGFGEADYIKCN